MLELDKFILTALLLFRRAKTVFDAKNVTFENAFLYGSPCHGNRFEMNLHIKHVT